MYIFSAISQILTELIIILILNVLNNGSWNIDRNIDSLIPLLMLIFKLFRFFSNEILFKLSDEKFSPRSPIYHTHGIKPGDSTFRKIGKSRVKPGT